MQDAGCRIQGGFRPVGGRILHLVTCILYLGWVGGSPIVGGYRHGTTHPGATGETLVVTGMLGGQNLAFLLAHNREIFEACHDLHAAEPAERDPVTRLTEAKPGLYYRIQKIGFVDNPHLAARWLEMNRCHLDFEL